MYVVNRFIAAVHDGSESLWQYTGQLIRNGMKKGYPFPSESAAC
jgi:hypothetical protein